MPLSACWKNTINWLCKVKPQHEGRCAFVCMNPLRLSITPRNLLISLWIKEEIAEYCAIEIYFFFNKSILRMCFNITSCRVVKTFKIFSRQLPIKIGTQNGCCCLQSLCKSPKKQLKIVWNLLNYRTKLLIILIISATICIESPKYVFKTI